MMNEIIWSDVDFAAVKLNSIRNPGTNIDTLRKTNSLEFNIRKYYLLIWVVKMRQVDIHKP